MASRLRWILPTLLALFILGSGTLSAKTKLVMVSHYQPIGAFKLLQDYIDEWNKQNPDVQVEHQAFDFAQLREKLVVMQTAGQSLDIVHIPNIWLAEFAGSGMLREIPADVKASMQQTYLSSALGISTYNGKMWGFPTEHMPRALVYNEALFDQAGLDAAAPKGWTELAAAAKKLTVTGADGKTSRWGFALWSGPYSPVVGTFLSFAWSNGADIFSGGDNRQLNLTQPASREAIQYLSDLVNVHKVATLTSSPMALFAKDQLAMYVSFGPWERDSLKAAKGKEWPDWSKQITSGPIPPGKTGKPVSPKYGWMFSVTTGSKSADQAYEFLTWLNTKTSSKETTRMGDLLAQLGSIPVTKVDLERQPIVRERYMRGFVDAAAKGYTRPDPVVPKLDQVYTALQKALVSILKAEKPAAEVLGAAETTIKALWK